MALVINYIVENKELAEGKILLQGSSIAAVYLGGGV